MATSWARRRQILYVSVAAIIFFAVFGTIGYFHFSQVPTCFDGKMNGMEKGVDCGGTCFKFCASETVAPLILWQRLFPANTALGYWSVVANVENPNAGASVKDIGYLFKIYDADGIPIGEKAGTTYLPANMVTPVYESFIPTGKHIPVRATFEFTTDPDWVRVGTKEQSVVISDQASSNEDVAPIVTAKISNQGLSTERNIEVIAIVYNQQNNAMAASRTVVDKLDKNETQDISFTWREAFDSPISRIEIVPRIDPYSVPISE